MCFSAEASFTVGGLLLPAGAYCVHTATRKNPNFLALSAIPLFFGMQQFCEGFVWIGLEQENIPLARGAALAFLFFAMILWPFWTSFSVLFLEMRPNVRCFLLAGTCMGLAFGLAQFVPIALDFDRWLTIAVVHHSIQYTVDNLPIFQTIPRVFWQILYAAIVFAPLVIVPNKHFRLFCLLLALATVISHFFLYYAYISIWCFFAAALSLQLCYVFHKLPRAEDSRATEVVGSISSVGL